MSVDKLTPNCTAIDSRGMVVRQIAYWQQDLSKHEARKTVQQRDAAGRLTAQQDPRLMTDPAAPANLVSTYSLSGKVLSTVSVDAGWRVDLFGAAGQLMWGCDARGSQRQAGYDNLLRPIAVFEQANDDALLCTERYEYGWADSAFSERNQCGQLIRHDESAGVLRFEQFGLAGEVLMLTRHYLLALEVPDWPEPVPERETLLEPGTEATSRSRFNALSEVIEQTDARGNRQFFSQTLAGQLRKVRLQLAKDVAPKVLVSAIQYNALGQMVRETAGNGVITSLEYAVEDGRLTRLRAKRGSDALQDLRYGYDPVGNVVSIEDAALPIRYFANQQIEPINRYVYNSLYQLIKATGWEAGGSNQGPAFSRFDDPASCANYSQSYRYDRGGNLLELTHDGPQSHGHRLVAAAQSNRCLPVINGLEPNEEDFRKSFDANGNLLNLQPGQVLRWDLRNQLREVSPVANDRERYVYGADGMRVRKVRSVQTNARTLISEVRYLPGLELRTHSGTGEALQVITVQAGRSSVRVLHWESEPPKDIANDQYRYSLNDHLGSCALELDSSGDIISHERYHPFGTTAWFAGRSEIEAGYKTVRYSGQERDATGLYYYGFRYYAPWMQRWLNPDPAGYVDDLNFYKMTINNPLVFIDKLGLAPVYAEGMEAQLAPHTNLIIEQPEANENFFVSYRVQGLKERLSAADELSKGRAEHVANAFTHKVILKTIVMTEPKIKDIDSSKVSKYFNMINKYEWEFKQNYKFKDSGNVFANDIFRHQYKLASEKNKNFGELPSAIRRSKVKNDTTLKTTEGLQSGTPELLDAFFKTPNGKTTQRVIEDFGMVATKVTTEANGKDLDFVVTVKPLGDYQTINTLQVQPKRTSKAAVFTKLTTT
jgi:insecticidal toxin complex protein TccC